MGNPTDEIRARLDELGVEYVTSEDDTTIFYDVDGNRYTYNVNPESGWAQLYGYNLTPEQAIAATVGKRTDLSKRLREVSGLHAFAELFGFSWEDDSDWTWHDVACAMADEIDAATVGVGTCKRIYHPNRITKKCTCSNCGYGASDERWAYCPKCGHKYVHGEVEEMMKAAGRKVAE